MVYNSSSSSAESKENTEIIINCQCHSHLILISDLDGDNHNIPDSEKEISIAFYDYRQEPRIIKTILHRVGRAFQYLFKGKVCSGEIILTANDAKELAHKLNIFISKNAS